MCRALPWAQRTPPRSAPVTLVTLKDERERASEAISSIKSDEFIPDRQKEIARMRGERGQIVEGRRDRGGGMSENEEESLESGSERADRRCTRWPEWPRRIRGRREWRSLLYSHTDIEGERAIERTIIIMRLAARSFAPSLPGLACPSRPSNYHRLSKEGKRSE